MIRLIGAPQHYAWGSTSAIPHALGLDPDGEPWAELWWGTHPGGHTLAEHDGDARPLVDLAGHLPFLVKLLAADRPLSLQVHPTTEQAAAGYAHEEHLGVPITAPHRVYRDPYAKPELVIAVTAFRALCGFRPVEEAAAEIEGAGSATVASHLRAHGPSATVAWLLHERPAVELDHPRFTHLNADYPGDPGAVVALLLNEVLHAPGEGLFVGTGVLHTYLGGVGLEVMSSSDNVVRAGFTTKHIDTDELLAIVDVSPLVSPVAEPVRDGAWLRYRSPTPGFTVAHAASTVILADGHHRIVAFLDERPVRVVHLGPDESLEAGRGAWVCTQI
ncbi:MAG: mannose-6-phosphate isomerase, class I [Actinomycetota bacterium]